MLVIAWPAAWQQPAFEAPTLAGIMPDVRSCPWNLPLLTKQLQSKPSEAWILSDACFAFAL